MVDTLILIKDETMIVLEWDMEEVVGRSIGHDDSKASQRRDGVGVVMLKFVKPNDESSAFARTMDPIDLGTVSS